MICAASTPVDHSSAARTATPPTLTWWNPVRRNCSAACAFSTRMCSSTITYVRKNCGRSSQAFHAIWPRVAKRAGSHFPKRSCRTKLLRQPDEPRTSELALRQQRNERLHVGGVDQRVGVHVRQRDIAARMRRDVCGGINERLD